MKIIERIEMNISKVKKTIQNVVTVERFVIVVGTIVTYTYVMNKFDYRMVKPAYTTDTHVVFNRLLGGITAIRFEK